MKRKIKSLKMFIPSLQILTKPNFLSITDNETNKMRDITGPGR